MFTQPSSVEETARLLVLFFEWILDVRIPEEGRKQLHYMYQEIANNQPQRMAEMQMIQQQYIGTIKQVQAMDRNSAILWRESSQQAIVSALRMGQDGLSRSLVALYDAANAPLVPGEPPLTQEIADCALEYLYFMLAAVQNTTPAETPPRVRQQWTMHLMQLYGTANPQERLWLANIPLMMAQIRVQWSALPEPQKQMYRNQWLSQLPMMANSPLWGPFMPAQGRAQQSAWGSGPAYPQAGYGSPNYGAYGSANAYQESSPDDLVYNILQSFDQKEKEAQETGDDFQFKQLEDEHQRQITQMLNDMSRMRYDNLMTVARNMR